MKIKLATIASAIALVALALSIPSAFGQGAAPAGPPAQAPGGQLGVNGIAVVDVAYIFKNHSRFKQQIDAMKKTVEAADAEVRRDQEDIKKAAEALKSFQPGTPDYKQREADLLKRQGELSLKVSLQKKDFMDQEGRIYFNVSREIDDAVKLLATRNSINLVLRFNGDPIDASDRNDILRGINKPIVFYDPRMDITPYVLQDLNRPTNGTGPIGVAPQNGTRQAPPR